jgi:hypothetical protein
MELGTAQRVFGWIHFQADKQRPCRAEGVTEDGDNDFNQQQRQEQQ